MRKIALVALLSLPLIADFFPAAMQTSILSVDGKSVKLKQSFPLNGMSGVVVHNYSNKTEAVTSYVVQNNGTVSQLDKDIIPHEALPTINTSVQPNDKVIGGYLYQNVMVLAPDADTYARITEQYKKHWIHPDLYAVYLAKEGEDVPTRENLSDFAKKYEVGLVMIVRNGTAVLFDPVSQQLLNTSTTVSNLPQTGKFPFFTRLDAINEGWFSKKAEGNYYDLMEHL